MRTRSRSVEYQRSYVSDHAIFEMSACLIVQGDEGIAGVTEPQLEEPIDFEAELAKRELERVPVDEPTDSDTSNDIFGI
jgi:hypothetical protein